MFKVPKKESNVTDCLNLTACNLSKTFVVCLINPLINRLMYNLSVAWKTQMHKVIKTFK